MNWSRCGLAFAFWPFDWRWRIERGDASTVFINFGPFVLVIGGPTKE